MQWFNVGDEFTLHSCQVRGTYDGYPHFALPGRHVVLEANDSEAVILKIDCKGPMPPTPFRCSQTGLCAVAIKR